MLDGHSLSGRAIWQRFAHRSRRKSAALLIFFLTEAPMPPWIFFLTEERRMGCVGEHQCHLLQGCMMYEEQFSSVRQFDAGQQHAQVYGSGMDAADIYERVAPQSVEESVI